MSTHSHEWSHLLVVVLGSASWVERTAMSTTCSICAMKRSMITAPVDIAFTGYSAIQAGPVEKSGCRLTPTGQVIASWWSTANASTTSPPPSSTSLTA